MKVIYSKFDKKLISTLPLVKFEGKIVVVVTNLKPVKLRGIESNGMLIAAGDEDVRLLTIDGELPAGTSIH